MHLAGEGEARTTPAASAPSAGAAVFAGVPICQVAELGHHYFSAVGVAGGCSRIPPSPDCGRGRGSSGSWSAVLF